MLYVLQHMMMMGDERRMAKSSTPEDFHFYVDNAPPREVTQVLRAMSVEHPLSPDEIAKVLETQLGFHMQKDHSYSPRRLHDLGLASQIRVKGRLKYILTDAGQRVQEVQTTNADLAVDLLHYLHYSRYSGSPTDRKYLWAYRQCCQIIWTSRGIVPPQKTAAAIQQRMGQAFHNLDWSARTGSRFNATAVSAVLTWLRSLIPSPFSPQGGYLVPRCLDRCELALLALDDLYRHEGYRYGDPVLLSEAVTNTVCNTFFMDRNSCLELLLRAPRVFSHVEWRDTLAGPSVSLVRPYTIKDVW